MHKGLPVRVKQLGYYVKFVHFGIDIVAHRPMVERMGLVVVESGLVLEVECMNYLYSEYIKMI